jgi:hypothetical protein
MHQESPKIYVFGVVQVEDKHHVTAQDDLHLLFASYHKPTQDRPTYVQYGRVPGSDIAVAGIIV